MNLCTLYAVSGGRGFVARQVKNWVNLSQPRQLYANPAEAVDDETYEEMLYGHIQPENIGQYALSGCLGGVTLTPEEARSLVDAEPEVVKDKVKTAADVLMYMLAARILDCGGDRQAIIGNEIWHYNLNAREVMEQHKANCGASANLANYLLEGDYDEVGFIEHAYYPGNGGGHVYNYILSEGKYTIVDFSWYIFALYRPDGDFPVLTLNSLDEYAEACPHLSPGQHLPNVFHEDGMDFRYIIPSDAQYHLIYQDESQNSFRLDTMEMNAPLLDWHKFW